MIDEEFEITPVKTNEAWQSRQKLKMLQAERDNRLDNLTFTTPTGQCIQCRLRDEQFMRNAIERMQRLGLTEQTWRLSDNTMGVVTIADLQSALDSGQDQGADVWQWFMSEVSNISTS